MSTADDEILSKATALVEQGSAADISKAIDQVLKDHPDLQARREQFWRQQPHGSPGVIPPTGAPRRPYHPPAHPEELPEPPDLRRIAPPNVTDAHRQIEELAETERAKHPELTASEALNKVLSTERGQRLQMEHGRQHYQRARGQ